MVSQYEKYCNKCKKTHKQDENYWKNPDKGIWDNIILKDLVINSDKISKENKSFENPCAGNSQLISRLKDGETYKEIMQDAEDAMQDARESLEKENK